MCNMIWKSCNNNCLIESCVRLYTFYFCIFICYCLSSIYNSLSRILPVTDPILRRTTAFAGLVCEIWYEISFNNNCLIESCFRLCILCFYIFIYYCLTRIYNSLSRILPVTDPILRRTTPFAGRLVCGTVTLSFNFNFLLTIIYLGYFHQFLCLVFIILFT
jgi:hypothetical protein